MHTPARTWTIMVYLAGNCGKQFQDIQVDAKINELIAIGSTDRVAVLAQAHTLTDEPAAYRIKICSAGQVPEKESIPRHNTGDPASLRDFITWGIEHSPAQHYAVIIRAHGTGWKEEDVYAAARQQHITLPVQHAPVRSSGQNRAYPGSALFLSSALQRACTADHTKRALAYDDAAMGFLDNAGLQRAFHEAEARSGQKLHLIGMDACLMSMVEVAYQLRGCAEYMVASQEREPLMGWPYGQILQGLNTTPDMTPLVLARQIVQAYQRYIMGTIRGRGATLSAINLSAISRLAETFAPFSRILQHLISEQDLYFRQAWNVACTRVVRFSDQDFADLHHLLTLLQTRYHGSDTQAHTILKALRALVAPQSEQGIVVEHFAAGRVSDAGGLSIYLPKRGISPLYEELDFARFGWGDFLRQVNQQ